MANGSQHPPIAVIGVSALFPESSNARGFWKNIVDGRDLISDVPPSHWLIDDYYDPEPGDADKTYCKRGGFLPDVEFDPVEFGIPPNNIPATDTTQLLALLAARKVLDDAFDARFAEMDKDKMSIVLGVTAGQELLIQAAARLQRPQWLAALREYGIAEDRAQEICDRIADKYTPWQENTFPGLLGNVVAGRIANRFDLGGTNCITDAACASSLSALSMAINELYLGHSDVVITGGVDCFNDIFMYMCFTKTPALSTSGDCRPFGDDADGTLMGEGLGMFALKRLDDAEEDGDRIYAVIRGLGSSSDGRSLSVYAPLPEGQAKALKRAHQRAGVDPETIELVEAHGTATKAGDVAEFKGLRQAFERGERDGPWCALGSVKSQIGHTKAAAGAAGLFKIIMALHHKILPPTIKVDRPNPKLDTDDSPFYVNTQARPWIRGSDHRRRAGISSFGFGGSNFHVVVEEYSGGDSNSPNRLRSLDSELFVFSSPTAVELRQRLEHIIDDLSDRPQTREECLELLQHIAFRSQRDFSFDAPHRLGLVASTLDELDEALRSAAKRLDSDAPEEFQLPAGPSYRNETVHQGDLAMLFPGQGSQYVGMGAELAMHFDAARQAWDEAADLGFGLSRRVFPPPAFDAEGEQRQRDELTATEVAQPAIGADSAARLAMLRALGIAADRVAGHSYGEVTALYAAGAWDRESMLRVARKRGELMAEAARTTSGAMTAVRSDADKLEVLLRDLEADVRIANDNSPGQVVLSGPTEAIEAAEDFLEQRQIVSQRLPVDTAFHSPIVAGATEPFAEFLSQLEFEEPALPVYANSTAGPYGSGDESLAQTLTSQIENPVRFVEMIRNMHGDGARTFVEVGPGSVLTGLVGRCLREENHRAISLDKRSGDSATAFFSGLASLATLGVEMDFSALWEGYAEPEDPRSRPKSKFTVRINGANVGRPYPPPGGSKDVPPPNERSSHRDRAGLKGSRPSTSTANEVTANGLPSGEETQRIFQHCDSGLPDSRLNGSTTQESTMSDDRPYANGHPGNAAPFQPTSEQRDSPRSAPKSADRSGGHDLRQDSVAADAFTRYQQSLADSHMAYLRLMEESVANAQMAYMRAMETSFRQWCRGDVGDVRDDAGQTLAAPPREIAPPDGVESGGRDMRREPPSTMPTPREAPAPSRAERQQAKNLRSTHSAAPEQSRSEEFNGQTSLETPLNDADLSTTFLEVVAEKTGYPVDMLDDDLALEADLGIDSIKRVEILSAVQEKVPSLPELDPNDMASLVTLGDISAHLLSAAPSTARGEAMPSGEAARPSPPPDPQNVEPPPNGRDLSAIFLDVVAEKTGYPVDMLDDGLALEADLGIDSIKRVEILSALQQEVPSLPELDPNDMASLQTLGEIIGHLESNGHSGESGGNRLGKSEPPASPAATPECWIPGLVAAPPAGINILANAPIEIIDDERGIGSALARELASRGYLATLTDEVDDGIQIIDLSGLSRVDSVDDALLVQKAAFRRARSIADSAQTFVIAFDTNGNFGLGEDAAFGNRAWLGGLSALAKTADLEWERAAVKAIDLATEGVDPTTVARRIADELTAGGPDVEVAFGVDGTRRIVRSKLAPPVGDSSTGDIGVDDVVLASGGARGVTAGCLIELARQYQPKIVLLGRTSLEEEPPCVSNASRESEIKRALIEEARGRGESPKPAAIGEQASKISKLREIRSTMEAIDSAGSTVRYVAADVRDRATLRRRLEEIRTELGSPTAIVHAAGVLADKFIADKEDEQFDFVFDTKVDGLRALLEVTEEDPLKHLCCFSSVAARQGNTGQADYAMANETLNKVSRAEAQRRGLRALSLNWGPWDGGMVDDTLRAHFQTRGVSLIDVQAGAATFCEKFAARKTTESSVELVVGDGLPEATENLRFCLNIDANSNPELAGHVIDGVVVVPAMTIATVFANAARSWRGDTHFQGLRDLRVLKGIRLPDFDDPACSQRFYVSSTTEGPDELHLELRGADDRIHYEAVALYSEQAPPMQPMAVEPPNESWRDAASLYDELLFHGHDFAAMKSIEGVGGPVARATVESTTPAIALDTGLQLLLAQGLYADGRSSLPTTVGTIIDAGLGDTGDSLTVITRIREQTAYRIVSDIDYLDEDGNPRAFLRDVEMHFFGEEIDSSEKLSISHGDRQFAPSRGAS